MTDPIVPSPEQVDQWFDDAVRLNSTPKYYIARQSALWGADQELEACCQSLYNRFASPVHQAQFLAQELRDWLRAARRPKPPSLKEQALEALERMDQLPTTEDKSTIRRALEALDD